MLVFSIFCQKVWTLCELAYLIFCLLQFFSIKMLEGIVATSYSAGEKFYIDPSKLLPLARFLPQPKYVCYPCISNICP